MNDEQISTLTDKFKNAMFGGLTENQILLGLASGSINVAGRGGIDNKIVADAKKEEKRKDERTAEIIKIMQSIIDQLEANVAVYEKEFERRHGDAWREKLVLQIFKPDEIPAQRDGESIDDYRDRLEVYLINEMLNEDGTIKAEYKNHPEFGEYAEWAQDKHHLNLAKELNSPETSTAYRDRISEKLTEHYGSKVLEQTAEQGGDLEQFAKTQMDTAEQSVHQVEQTSEVVDAFSVRR